MGEPIGTRLVAAGTCMAIGVYLHLTESHAHMHTHFSDTHAHWHTHDLHHQHEHFPPVSAQTKHHHRHTHLPLQHSHEHFPDAHHRHEH